MTATRSSFPPFVREAARLLGGALLALTALAVTPACGPPIPDQPSYSKDIAPILDARCNRCHDGMGFPSNPQEYGAGLTAAPAYNTEAAAEQNAMLIDDCVHSKALCFLEGDGVDSLMPPPPAAPLEDWQLTIIENWARDVRAGVDVP